MEEEKLDQSVVPRQAALASTGRLLGTQSQALSSTSDLLNQKLLGWTQQSVLINPAGDPDSFKV